MDDARERAITRDADKAEEPPPAASAPQAPSEEWEREYRRAAKEADEMAPAPPPASAAPAPAPEAPRRVGAAADPVEPTPMPPRIQNYGGLARNESAGGASSMRTESGMARQASAPADATAFAPKKLRRGSPELVRVVIHQPKDLKAVIKAARKIDPRADAAPQGMRIGDVAFGAAIGVALEVRGASCDGAIQRRNWVGEPLDFSFAVEPEEDAKQSVLIARIFINDAQIGIIAFTRPISGPKKKPADVGDGARMKRFKRVFLSYSSKDRAAVAVIATAYQMAGVEHFWDRTGLKSGEEWSPRLRKEIDKADLFHLCWSKSAATSEWVEKEAEHALERRKRTSGKTPNITVQMLDGPPWAPHPKNLDAINFDDFVRAAIVGYARGEG